MCYGKCFWQTNGMNLDILTLVRIGVVVFLEQSSPLTTMPDIVIGRNEKKKKDSTNTSPRKEKKLSTNKYILRLSLSNRVKGVYIFLIIYSGRILMHR